MRAEHHRLPRPVKVPTPLDGLVRGDAAPITAAALLVVSARTTQIAGGLLLTVGLPLTLWLGTLVPRRASGRAASLRHRGAPALAVLLLMAAVRSQTTRALDGLDVQDGPIRGWAELLTDPERTPYGSVRAQVRFEGAHLEATATGADGTRLRALAAGQSVLVEGRRRHLGSASAWSISRHLAGRVEIGRIVAVSPGGLPAQAANGLRRWLLAGASVLPGSERSLFTGLVLGDDRDQSGLAREDFRAAGLSHLLVVSGQNLAFVFLLLSPLLRRIPAAARLPVTVGVAGGFCVVTRFEPSVARAAAMCLVAGGAVALGRRQHVLRVLAIAVGALVVVDPLLCWSLGFAMSVAACLGLGVFGQAFSARAQRRLPGVIGRVLGLTIAAQCGVAAVVLPTIGSTPVAALPANVVAIPVAEPLVVWGLGASAVVSLLAPVTGDEVHGAIASVLHLPTVAGLRWIEGVARLSARAPLGEVSARSLLCGVLAAWAVLGAGLVARSFGARWLSRPRCRRSASWALCCGLAVGVFAGEPAGASGVLRRRQVVLTVRSGERAGDVLARLHRARVTAVDLVIVESGGRSAASIVTAVAHRCDVGAVLVSDRSQAGHVRPVVIASDAMVLRVGSDRVRVVESRAGGVRTVVERVPGWFAAPHG